MLTKLNQTADLFAKQYPQTIDPGGVAVEVSYLSLGLLQGQKADGTVAGILILDAKTNTLRPATHADIALINTSTGKLGFGAGSGGAVTQITSVTTGVEVDFPTGVITTFAQTLAAGAAEVFTVTNNKVAANDVVVACVGAYAGTGIPVAEVKNVVAGAFDIVVKNNHASAALNALILINFAVIKGSNS